VTAPVLDKVQAHVLRPASPDLSHTAFHFVTLPDRPAGLRLVDRLLKADLTLSDAATRGDHTGLRCHVAVGFTRDGLKKLRIPYDSITVLEDSDPFHDGMGARRELLCDPDTRGWAGMPCDMLLWVASSPDLARHDDFARILADAGITDDHVEHGARKGESVSILGFRDGTSQPYLSELASSRDGLAGGGTRTRDGWQPVRIGEFVLGSTDEGGERLLPGPEWLSDGGTYLVYRKYWIDTEAIDTFLRDAGDAYEKARGGVGAGAATVAAKVVGRFRLGESPVDWPEGHDGLIATSSSGQGPPQTANDFVYGHDTYGHACPLGAHIRRTNPRDALGFDGQLTKRHRIVRRGVTWETATEMGLHFVAVNARIHDQFEFIQRLWLNTGAAFRQGADVDLVAGSWPEHGGPVSFVIQGDPPVVVRARKPIATLRGGGYFLLPGMEGLRRLAEKAR
jgi:deferrochelatase/peroxidase EfeB